MDRSKSPVTRGALERVLARAAELQAANSQEGEPADALTEEQVLDLGREVGLSPEHIRQALAEERVRIEPVAVSETGMASRLFGATRVAAQRVVRGAPERLLATLDRWMQREEWLRVVRQRADRIVWEPRRGFFGSVRQLLRGRDYALYRSNDISATVVRMDNEFTLVRLEADFTVLRRGMAGQTAIGAVIGGASTGALVVMGVMLPVAVAPIVVIAGATYASSRRTQRNAIQRASLTLELVLDRLESGEAQPPALMRLIEAALPPPR
jgi:uncharacterized membrane protein